MSTSLAIFGYVRLNVVGHMLTGFVCIHVAVIGSHGGDAKLVSASNARTIVLSLWREFADPAGQTRAKIYGNCLTVLTVFLVRARVAAFLPSPSFFSRSPTGHLARANCAWRLMQPHLDQAGGLRYDRPSSPPPPPPFSASTPVPQPPPTTMRQGIARCLPPRARAGPFFGGGARGLRGLNFQSSVFSNAYLGQSPGPPNRARCFVFPSLSLSFSPPPCYPLCASLCVKGTSARQSEDSRRDYCADIELV